MQTKSWKVYRVGTVVVLAMALSWGSLPARIAEPVRRTEVSIRGDMFFINGRPTYEGREHNGMKIEGLLMNSRMVQGIFDDLNPETVGAWAYPDTGKWDAERNTREFIAAMPSWRAHGMLSFVINLQGGFPGEGYPGARQLWHNSALRPDGSLRDDYMNRLERILDRADELGMVPMLGIYYFGQDERIEDEAAVIRGVQNAVNWVLDKGYRNVLIEINNECNVRYDHAILQPARVHELIELAKGITRDGRRLYVSTSYGGNTIPRENVVRASDYLLLHGNGVNDPKRIAEMVRQTRRVPGYRPMPILFNEDDHYDFEKPMNNYLAAVGEYASWGYFDYRRRGEPFEAGYQAVPADWAISHSRKQGFFELTRTLTGVAAHKADHIRPYAGNPYYWQYKGKPVLLLGGSWQDNLFNHPVGLERHLDVMKSVGGNYVRNVMSHRNVGNVFAFGQVDGKFDLDRWNDEYWRRFENFLKLTHERDIMVQIEIWATWDHYEDHQSLGGWSKHPFNPVNNITYTAAESGLPTQVTYAPRGEPTAHAFFRSVPALDNNELVLRYQRAFVDKLLSHSLAYPHVLYCMNNETGERVEWGDYWASYVRRRAWEAGAEVHITDMRRSEDVRSKDHAHIFDRPDLYTFVDISQNNAWAGLGQKHYDNILYVREHLAKRPRPINNNKNYGAARHGEEESVARFCRIVFAGCAGVRFHRPHPREDADAHEAATEFGLGLSPRAQAIIASMREIANAIEFVRTKPRNDLLSDRQPNEAYCLAEPGRQYAVYFPDGGAVTLDVSETKGPLQVRWLDVNRTTWQPPQTVTGGGMFELKTPGKGHWAVLVQAR
jgi:hypothetical protein